MSKPLDAKDAARTVYRFLEYLAAEKAGTWKPDGYWPVWLEFVRLHLAERPDHNPVIREVEAFLREQP